MMIEDTGRYDWLPLDDRPKIDWPGGARLAFWVAPNIEFYELEPPRTPARSAWPRPVPDILGYTLRDYGNRAAVWRMIEVMDRYGVRGSISLNVAVCDHFPEIAKALADRGWEFFSHGVYNTRYLYHMDEAQERQLIRDVKASVEKWSGQKLSGWLSPALSNTVRTMDFIAEEGVEYTLDLLADDQPFPVKVRQGRLCSIPYSLEVNDWTALHIAMATPAEYVETCKLQFDRLYAEGGENGRVMCLPLHPFLVGVPHRVEAFAEVLDYVTGHDGVWLATGREIARWYLEHHYEAALRHIKSVR
jgi:peptidoglycan/xylan/chitin deacetylase (PgdA/CDA1 family)